MHAPPTYREHAGGCDGDDAGGQHVERSRPTRHASGCDEPGVSRGLSEAIRGQSYAFSGLWLTNLELLEGCEMPRRLTHGRLGLLRQLVHARCPLLVADLALGTARLWGEERGRRGEHAHCSSLISRSERRVCSVRSSTTSSKGVHQGQSREITGEIAPARCEAQRPEPCAASRPACNGGEGQSAYTRGRAVWASVTCSAQ